MVSNKNNIEYFIAVPEKEADMKVGAVLTQSTRNKFKDFRGIWCFNFFIIGQRQSQAISGSTKEHGICATTAI